MTIKTEKTMNSETWQRRYILLLGKKASIKISSKTQKKFIQLTTQCIDVLVT